MSENGDGLVARRQLLVGFAAASAATTLLACAPLKPQPKETIMADKTNQPFEFTAAYNWGQLLDSGNAVTYTRAGVVAGSWQWRFSDGKKGNTHFLAHSFYRSVPNILLGTITFNMHELEGTKAGEDELYVAYQGTSFDQDTGTVAVEGLILGGKGKYAGAGGKLSWVSTNGFIERGSGVLKLG
jgi:hypothetical protein